MLAITLLKKVEFIYMGNFGGRRPRKTPPVFSRTDFLAWQTTGNAHTLLFITTFVSRSHPGTLLLFVTVF
jgi:hypothetical protein